MASLTLTTSTHAETGVMLYSRRLKSPRASLTAELELRDRCSWLLWQARSWHLLRATLKEVWRCVEHYLPSTKTPHNHHYLRILRYTETP